MIKSILTAILISVAILPAGARSRVKAIPALGDTHMEIFHREPIRFLPGSLGNFSPADSSGVIHLTNGRIILKKIQLPDYKRDITINLHVSVESNGDRWDKSGSVFVIPESSTINLLTVSEGSAKFPKADSTRYETLRGAVPGENFLPTVELMRFMTPFGVGWYSRLDTAKVSPTRPSYIDGWADCTDWDADVTDLYPLLQGEAWVGVFIDTWTPEGYIASVSLDIKETPSQYFPLRKRTVIPLVNTIYYTGEQVYPDIFARKDLIIDFTLPSDVQSASLRYITTGHGGNSGGDEFTPQRHIIGVDGRTVLDFTPWRTDCASFRRFNPTSGSWLIKREVYDYSDGQRVLKEIEESIASSDFSRSNWCPGSSVLPIKKDLGPMKAGGHTIVISIPGAQAHDKYNLNHWLTSAYLILE